MIWLGVGFVCFIALCVFALFLARSAEQQLKRSLHQSLHNHSAYVRYMQDKHDLNGIGYPQQLTRHIGGFSSFGMAFSTMALIGGAVMLLGPAIAAGGPITVGFGWPILALFGLVTACSLASFASATPTAGGSYHWALAAGGRRFGLWSGWLHLLGSLLMLVTTNLLLADWIYALMVEYLHYAGGKELFYMLLLVICFTQAVVNAKGAHAIGRLLGGSAILQLLLVAAIISYLAYLVWPGIYPVQLLAGDRNLFSKAPSLTASDSGTHSLILGMLLLQRLFIGCESPAQLTEETNDPRINAPWAIFFSTVVTGVLGFVLFTFLLLHYPLGGSGGYNSYLEMTNWFVSMWSKWGSILESVFLMAIVAACWINGTAIMASASRNLFALARDDSTPCAKWLGIVSVQYRTPVYAVIVVSSAACLAMLGLKAASLGMTSQAALVQLIALTITLIHAAYALPIAARLRENLRTIRTGGQAKRHRGPWHLGRYSGVIDVTAFCWLAASSGIALFELSAGVLLWFCAALLAGCGCIELKHHAMMKKQPVKIVGSSRFTRTSIDECIRIERKFPQH
ncbi:APC family permease [Paenibacillus sp. OV219]|uniref:APC family permease n=1 Tax=Paenibacillus sp. OV219 TaxID=1884377 RepID=UPI0008D81832|nr:amino acid permease [Paenibacillus sp. OV219]SEM85647.1 Amino acid transporter [Paenibacillus sp. OV219]